MIINLNCIVHIETVESEGEGVKVRVHVFVSGSVQGVFFRSEMRDEAEKLGLKGWVRNLPDGRVEALFEGEEESVKRLVDFCRRGPRGAIVKGTNVAWENYTGEFSGFKIRY
jgi:acylphosphatase